VRRALLLGALAGTGCGGAGGSGQPAPAGPILEEQISGTDALLIAVSAPSSRVVWVAGTRGTFVLTTDGGTTWRAAQVPGAERLQFRDVHALDERTAWLLSIGNADSSRIYHTSDGGASWTLRFSNPEPAAFYDCFAFWDRRRGIVVSDAVGGRAVLRVTHDGGRSWDLLPPARLPAALPAEGAFAASGTCVHALPGGRAWVAFGTPTARLFTTADYGSTWRVDTVPLAAISSVSFRDARHGIVLGTDSSAATATTGDGGRTWTRGAPPPFSSGFYGGAFVPGARVPTVVAVGPGGAAWSRDAGASWTVLSRANFWGVGFAPDGTGWIAGQRGRIWRVRGS
jgi:photosystem II stability/assembly factor-like uncharacterized protein